MTAVNKVSSNATTTSFAWETIIGVLPGTPVWNETEPNSFSDFGGQVTTMPRAPINANRKNKKGPVTDLDASGGYNTDLTQKNMQDLLQGFFFANHRKKGDLKNDPGITTLTISATASSSTFTRVGGTTDLTTLFSIDDLVLVAGFSDNANNGLFKVSAVTATTVVVVAADGTDGAVTLVDEGATSAASIIKVGIESDAGDIDVDMTGTRPALTSTTVDFTAHNLVVGEPIFIGGDATISQFAGATNNNLCRVRSITATRLEFDKTFYTMVTEANTTLLIQLFFGRVLKDETGTLIVTKPVQLERTLGVSDDAHTAAQAEYLEGSICNELTLNTTTADKLNVDLGFISMKHTQRISGDGTGDTGPKDGTRVGVAEADAFNTSSDFSRIKLAIMDETDANPSALFGYATDISININNGAVVDKAVGVLGGFDVTVGNFTVGGDVTAYFADVAAVAAIQANADVTLDLMVTANNAGFAIDMPLITLGNGRLTVEKDTPIKIPLEQMAATASKIDSNMDHTLLITFFDYLPSLADVDL
ncbi:MAG: hypothetical protein KAR40_06050 [Candidatus Sabulitectum sp.]|nr:hypothetical protein [Candidatus Sabulitectum sp.]